MAMKSHPENAPGQAFGPPTNRSKTCGDSIVKRTVVTPVTGAASRITFIRPRSATEKTPDAAGANVVPPSVETSMLQPAVEALAPSPQTAEGLIWNSVRSTVAGRSMTIDFGVSGPTTRWPAPSGTRVAVLPQPAAWFWSMAMPGPQSGEKSGPSKLTTDAPPDEASQSRRTWKFCVAVPAGTVTVARTGS